ncbi:MAG TPA: serine hydrolase domain-containing protein [Cyclobacteriaceae bacterium]|nr:serine hydrolase domain-containing protein [Cyclobacteriaceae bacterium]
MKPHYLPFFLVVLVFVSCGEKKKADPYARVGAHLDSLVAGVKDFSGVLLVADSGKTIYHKAFGYRNFDTKEPIDTASVFELASVSKQFTSMVIMMLKEEGKLGYDDPLEKYLPIIPYKNITIRHLLTHTSGLPDYQAVMDQHWDKTKVAGNAECIEYLVKYAPAKLFEPGEKYEYSNTGYMLLASVAEKASGIEFISFARARIFAPVEMTTTDIRTQDEKSALRGMAWGHIWVNEKNAYVRADSMIQFNYGIWLGNRKGPGRISSTSSDMLKWDQELYKGTLVSNETLNDAFTPMILNSDSVSNYGFGWTIQDHPLGKVVRHSGSNPGYNTHIVRYTGVNRTIIMLCNNAHPKFNEILKGVEAVVGIPTFGTGLVSK